MIFRNLRTARTVLVATAAVGALVLSACGSSDTGATGSSTSAVTTSSAGSASSDTTSTESSADVIQPVATATTATADELSAAKASLVSPGVLTVCTTLAYPPFEASDIDGKIVGFDMDMMDLLAADLGATKTVIDTDFTGIKSGQAMTSGICDISSAAMTINPERQAVISFSDPYYSASQVLLVLDGSSVTGLADLKDKKIGAQTGTTGQSYAQKNAAANGYTVVEYTSITDVEAAVQSGNVEAGIHDDGPLYTFVQQQAGAFKIAANFATGEQYGFGAKLGNTALVAVTNAMLKRSMEDGTFKTISEKWFPTS